MLVNIHSTEPSSPEPGLSRIAVRSRSQAMDLSLVLVSQGIESTIDPGLDGSGWGLLVSAAQSAQAIEAIEQYRRENRGWGWRTQVFRPGVFFDWSSLAWVALVAFFYWVDRQVELQGIGTMLASAVTAGQWWRLFTAVWLHADAGHLATNAVFGMVLLGLAMGRYGTGAGLFAAYLAGVGGNLAGLIRMGGGGSLGASGMVMGALGLLAAQSFASWQQKPVRYLVSGIVAGAMLFTLFGLGPGTDVLAHLGGFISGLVLGGCLTILSIDASRSKANLVAGVGFVLLVIIPWWVAFRARG